MREMKLDNVDITTPLYWRLSEYPEEMYRIFDFNFSTVTTTKEIEDSSNFWLIEALAWQVNKVLTKQMNWPDFVLTFRVKLARTPDIYNTVIHGFIALDACEIGRFCDLVLSYRSNNKERITVEYNGKEYSILRWCPHLGGDLNDGWLEDNCWVCPRHHWHYDLTKHGKCVTSNETIDAICLNKKTDSNK